MTREQSIHEVDIPESIIEEALNFLIKGDLEQISAQLCAARDWYERFPELIRATTLPSHLVPFITKGVNDGIKPEEFIAEDRMNEIRAKAPDVAAQWYASGLSEAPSIVEEALDGCARAEPSWINTPEETKFDYCMCMYGPNGDEDNVDMTRAEYVKLKKILATMRGEFPTGDGQCSRCGYTEDGMATKLAIAA